MTAQLETTTPERTTTEQPSTGKDRRRLWTGLVALVAGLILAGIAIGAVSLIVQSRPSADAREVDAVRFAGRYSAPAAVFSPEAIRVRNAEGALQQDTLSPEAIRVRNAEGAFQQDTLSPEAIRVRNAEGAVQEETLSPERYRK